MRIIIHSIPDNLPNAVEIIGDIFDISVLHIHTENANNTTTDYSLTAQQVLDIPEHPKDAPWPERSEPLPLPIPCETCTGGHLWETPRHVAKLKEIVRAGINGIAVI